MYLLPILLIFINFVYCQQQPYFTIVVLPDTQFYSSFYEETFQEQTFWACQCASKLNIKFVSHLGDIVHRKNKYPHDWANARRAIKNLIDCKLPFGILPGNHDADYGDKNNKSDPYLYFHKNFPLSNYDKYNWFGKSYNNFDMRNTYQLIDDTHIFIHLEYLSSLSSSDRKKIIDWTFDILRNQYPNRIALLSTHHAASDCTDHIKRDIKNLLYENCNLKFVFGGHVFHCGGERTISLKNKCGQLSYIFVSNYQDRTRGGNSWLRYYTFDNDNNKLCVYTFSPYDKKFELDDNSYFSINLTNMSLISDGCSLSNRTCQSHYASPGFVLASVWIASANILFLYFLILIYLKFL